MLKSHKYSYYENVHNIIYLIYVLRDLYLSADTTRIIKYNTHYLEAVYTRRRREPIVLRRDTSVPRVRVQRAGRPGARP